MFGNFYQGKNVFVTGHTGFKGSWLSAWLLKLGANVTGYALPPAYDESHFELLGMSKKLRHIEGDVRDREHLTRAGQVLAVAHVTFDMPQLLRHSQQLEVAFIVGWRKCVAGDVRAELEKPGRKPRAFEACMPGHEYILALIKIPKHGLSPARECFSLSMKGEDDQESV